MTPFEQRVLVAAEIWFKTILKANQIKAHEQPLFAAVAEWLARPRPSISLPPIPKPWDRPPTLLKLRKTSEELEQEVFEAMDESKIPTIPAPATTEDLRARTKF